MGDVGTTSALYAARPLLTIDGNEDRNLSEDLISLMVEETTDGLFRCEATFANWGSRNGSVDYVYLDRALLDFGTSLSIDAGSADTRGRIFDGRITALEAHYPGGQPPEITVLAEDRLQDLRMTRRTRTFDEASVSDIIDQIGSAHSLRTDVEVEGPTYTVVVQVNQSDLAFLRDRARDIDAEVWVEGDTLFARQRSRRTRDEEVALTYLEGLHEFSVLIDLARQRTKFVVSGWDVAAKEDVLHEATESAIQSELNGFESGAAVLQGSFGDRVERIVHASPSNLEEARTLAESHFRRMARRFVSARGSAEGDARIRVGTRVEINGVGEINEGRYYVTAARHTFDSEFGYRTQFEAERPGLNRS